MNIGKFNNNQLAYLRTHLSLQRTYMATLRTVAIFVGLSLILMDKLKEQNIAFTITIITLILTLFSFLFIFSSYFLLFS